MHFVHVHNLFACHDARRNKLALQIAPRVPSHSLVAQKLNILSLLR